MNGLTMRLKKVITMIMFVVTALISIPAIASTVYTEKFDAQGIGSSPSQARENAIENALRKSIGEFIVSKEELNNDVFTQQMIGYTNGYIKSIEIQSQTQLPSGDYQSIVTVEIESQKLIELLQEKQVAIINSPIDQETLLKVDTHFEAQNIEKTNEENFESLVKELLLQPFFHDRNVLFVNTVGKLEPFDTEQLHDDYYLKPYKQRYDENKRDLFAFELTLEIGVNKNYTDGLQRILKEASATNGKETKVSVGNLTVPERSKISTMYFDKDKYFFIDSSFSEDDIKLAIASFDYIHLELVDSTNEVFKEGKTSLVGIATPREKTIPLNTFLMNTEDFEEAFSYHLLPDYFDGSMRYYIGSKKVRTILFLTKNDISDLKQIRVSFSTYK